MNEMRPSGHDMRVQAQALLADAPKAGGRWRHYKGGTYTVVCSSIAEDTLTPLVTYRSETYGSVFTRTLDNWREEVEGPDGRVPRFVPLTPPGQND